MEPDDVLSLLPSLPSLEDLSAPGLGGTQTASFVKLTDEEFRAALNGEVPIANSQLSLPEIAERMAGLGSGVSPLPSAYVRGTATESTTPQLPTDSPEGLVNGFVWAAALRYTYLLDTLTPAPTAPGVRPKLYGDLSDRERDAVFAHLTGRSDVVAEAGDSVRWMLRDDERREALRGLFGSGMVKKAVKAARQDAEAEAREAARAREAAKADAPSEAAPVEESATVDTDASASEKERSVARKIEETLWGYLTKGPLPLEGSERKHLLVVQRVIGWLQELGVGGLPSPAEVSRQLAHETLLQPFHHLTGEWKDGVFTSNFIGREAELNRIYDYLSVLPPASIKDGLRRTYVSLVDTAWRILHGAGHRPLLIHGPGGVGKSSLLAKFLLDHLTKAAPGDRFPYAYLDFDLSSLTAREPLTLLAEAARQLAAQYPPSAEQWNAARAAWLEQCRLAGPDFISPEARNDALRLFIKLLNESETDGQRASALFARGLPFLLVLDTFEELQYHDRDAIKDTFRFLNVFRDELPALRVVMMGRAPLSDVQQEYDAIEAAAVEGDVFGTGIATDFDVIEVPLGDLDEEAARAYLIAQGISDADLAVELVEVVGANPLSLRLIVRVFKQGRLDLKSLREETNWRRGFGDWLRGRKMPPRALLQGVLFDRILGHIHTPQVKKLAHPGLVLRRVTPELIREVLAGPCGLNPLLKGEERRYFDLLAREVSLVGTDRDVEGAEVLRHRPELRRIMLRLMSSDESKREQIQQVHENAVTYYEARPGRLAQEEALYHRLMLGEPPRPESLLDEVPTEEAVEAGYAPTPDAEKDPRPVWRSLAKVVEELPVAGAAYLAARLHQELLPDAAWESVDRQDWELMILGRASRRARERNNVISALEGLRREQKRMLDAESNVERRREFSPLPLIEVVLLERLSQYKEASECASWQLEFIPDTARNQRCDFQYHLLLARLAAHLGKAETCETRITKADFINRKMLMQEWSSVQVVGRCERQLLRFANDCFVLLPTRSLARIVFTCIVRLAADTEALKNFPALTRHAVTSVISSASALQKHDPPAMWDEDMLRKIFAPRPLEILLTRLSPAAADGVAATLSGWTMKSAEGLGIYKLLSSKTRRSKKKEMEEEFRERLRNDPTAFAECLAGFLSASSSERAAELCRALQPGKNNSPDEDPFEEARRSGDLLPGEGPSVVGSQHDRNALTE